MPGSRRAASGVGAIGLMVPSIVDMSLSDWRRQTAVNLDGVFLSVKYGIPLMRRSGGGLSR